MTGPADHFRPLGRGAAFSRANKLERVIWQVVWLLLARATPPQLAPWRRFLLRLFGARIGSGAKIYGSARICLPRHLEIGEGTPRLDSMIAASSHGLSKRLRTDWSIVI